MSYRILTIDPGSTSTKIGVFDDEKMLFEENLHHSAEELAQFETIPQQEAFRRRLVLKALEEHHIPLESLSAVCGRGGVLKPVHGGTYLTTDAMIDTLKKGPYGHHASNLGGLLAREIGSALHIPSYICLLYTSHLAQIPLWALQVSTVRISAEWISNFSSRAASSSVIM